MDAAHLASRMLNRPTPQTMARDVQNCEKGLMRGSKFRKPRTSDLRSSCAVVLLGGWSRLDEVVGRQLWALQAGGEERLNLAA